MSEGEKFFGKYRGKVENNLDPLQQGRLQVSCAAVLGEGSLSWAMPCVPFAGSGVGFFALPPSGANLWVEFEGGDPDYPIWSGCFWGLGEVPAKPALEQMKVIKTDSITLTLSDLPGIGGFTLEVSPPAVATPLKMVFNAQGIELSNGAASVKLTPASVSVNNGALEVI
jgi:Type VI secretion system/phage-baseplate injector OB domain